MPFSKKYESVNCSIFQRHSWKGSPLYYDTKIIAVCEERVARDVDGIRIVCRKTETVFDEFVLPAINKKKRSSEVKGKKESESSSSGKKVL